MLKLNKNKAKQALVAAAQKSKVDNINLPNLVFPAYNDNCVAGGVDRSAASGCGDRLQDERTAPDFGAG